MNVGLLLQVRERILAHPENYDQGSYCGTACCIAGHAVIAAGHILEASTVRELAAELIAAPPASLVRLFGFFLPEEFYAGLLGLRGSPEHAQAAADAIIDFIITDGWTTEADPSKLLLAEPAASPETAEQVVHA